MPEREQAIHPPRQDSSITTNGSRDHVSEPPSPRTFDLPLPVFPLPRFSLSPSGIHKMSKRRLLSSEPGNDHSNTKVGSRSKHKGIESEAGTSSSRIAWGSIPSRLRTSIDQGTSMQARRRRRRDPLSQSSNLTSPRSDLAPEAFRGSGLPLSESSNLFDVSLSRKDTKTQAVKRIPRSPPTRLVSRLPDQAFTQSDEVSLDDSPCTSGKAQKGRRSNDYPISSRPRGVPSPDSFLPRDSGEDVRLRIITAFTDLDPDSL
jgi:hypothetical protein